MTSYIAFLRGINVGGHRSIKMADLRQLVSGLGYHDTATYIQSGNVVFKADTAADPTQLANEMEASIERVFGHQVPVMVRPAAELSALLTDCPFSRREGWKRYLSFLKKPPAPAAIQSLQTAALDHCRFALAESAVYSQVNKQPGIQSRFSNALIEKLLKSPATTRNLQTVQQVLTLSS